MQAVIKKYLPVSELFFLASNKITHFTNAVWNKIKESAQVKTNLLNLY